MDTDGWTKTKRGRVVYPNPYKAFTVRDLARIFVAILLDRARTVDMKIAFLQIIREIILLLLKKDSFLFDSLVYILDFLSLFNTYFKFRLKPKDEQIDAITGNPSHEG